MSNEFAIGSSLVIPDNLIKNLKAVDDKIKDIQTHASGTKSAVEGLTTAFKNLNSQLTPAAASLQAFETALSKVGGTEKLTKALTKASEESVKVTGSITKAADGLNKMNKGVQDDGHAWQLLEARINAAKERQNQLLASMREYERIVNDIKSGKGGVLYDSENQKKQYGNNKREYGALVEHIENLRKEQEQLIASNKEYQKRKEMLESLKTYHTESNTLSAQRSADELQKLNEYYRGLEKTSAADAKKADAEAKKAANEREKALTKEEKEIERVTKAYEKYMAKVSATTAAYGRQYHNQRQSMYDSLFSPENTDKNTLLKEASLSSSINERIALIKRLESARNSLSTSDKNYSERLKDLNEKIKELNRMNQKAIASSKTLGEQYNSLGAIAERMGKRMLVYFTFDYLKDFANKIVEVRGNFELQQRSLEAILQNKNKADQIFSQTVELATKSPFQIQQLVTYTKQLAAYRIESDKLYDTTKRLADVSAGLGVDMQRLILAYGQVKAAAYLRGTEVRQFTEAGINLYGELQKYFEEVEGEAYTTAQIVDMISKRMVTFEDVEKIFERLTDKGGLFYNMQEIQAETLSGKISNLKDSFDIMYNEIGKGYEGMLKGTIDGIRSLAEHWKELAEIVKIAVSVFAMLKVQTLYANSALSIWMSTFWKGNMLNKVVMSWEALGMAIKGVGNALKASIPGLILYGVIESLSTLYAKITDHNDAVRKATEENIKLAASFRDLNREVMASEKKFTDGSSTSYSYDWGLVRTSLSKLKAMLEKEGFEINIDVAKLDEAGLVREYTKASEIYKNYVKDLLAIKKAAADDDEYNGWFTLSDTIDEDAKDYSNAVIDVLGNTKELDLKLGELSINYKDLTNNARKYYEQIQGMANDERDINYYMKVYDLLTKIKDAQYANGKVNETTLDLKNFLNGVGRQLEHVNDQADEFADHLDQMFKDVDKSDGVKVKVLIDKVAAEREWSLYTKEFAYKHLNATVDITTDKDKMQKELDSLSVQIQNYFLGKSFSLNLNFGSLDTAKGFEEYDKEAQHYLKELGKLIAAQNHYNKAKKEGSTLNGYDEIGTQAEINDYIKKLKALGYVDEVNALLNKGTKTIKNANKAVRDLLQERIDVLDKMQSAYEKRVKYMGKDDAMKSVLKSYADNLKYVQMPETIMNGFVPTKEGLKSALEKLLPTISDFKKKSDIQQKIANLTIEIDQEKLKESLDNAKAEIESMLDKLDLHTKLVEMGLGEGDIQQMFGPLETSLDNINNKALEVFQSLTGKNRGENGEAWGSEMEKTYQDYLKKIQEKQENFQYKQFEELTKAYKKQMEGQLAIDLWYAEERNKILNSEQLNKSPELQQAYKQALDEEYKKRSDNNTWKEFQESSMYTLLFDNLEQQSTRVLNSLKARLQDMRSSLNNLDPSNLKAITEQINKIDNSLNKKNPFRALTSGLKEYIKFLRERKGLEEKLALHTSLESSYSSTAQKQNNEIITLQKQLESEKKVSGVNSEQVKKLQEQINKKREMLNITLAQKEAEGKITKELADQISKGLASSKTMKEGAQETVDIVNSAVSAIEQLYDAFGGKDEDVKKSFALFESMGSLAASIASGNIAGIISGSASTIASAISLFNGDSKKQKQIEELQESIDALAYSYNRLKKASDEAWDSAALVEYSNRSIENIKLQIKQYEAMVAAEKSKKDSDSSTIRKYEEAIQDLKDTIIEQTDTINEALGGIGSDANYKSAAQEFADAWVDAFNSSENTLEALNKTMDNFFDNLIKKQMMNRVVKARMEGVLKAIDNAVSQGSEGGNSGTDVTANELANIKKLAAEATAQLNQDMKALADVLNVTSSSSSGLSALQKGIQAVTEETASAIEALMNSIRFDVAINTTNVTAIRTLLEQTLGNSGEDSIIREMRTQTSLIRSISTSFSDIIKAGHSKGGYGLKVFND